MFGCKQLVPGDIDPVNSPFVPNDSYFKASLVNEGHVIACHTPLPHLSPYAHVH